MQIQKIIFLLLFPLLSDVLLSCCDCTESHLGHYTNTEIFVANLDNSGNDPVVSNSLILNKQSYGIRVNLNRVETGCIQKKLHPVFIQSAYATSCGCPPPVELSPNDSITSIRILSSTDFDATHAANTEITNYFRLYYTHSQFLMPIDEYLKTAATVLYYESELAVQFDLLLMSPPTIHSKNKFIVQILLSDGRILEQETPEIELV